MFSFFCLSVILIDSVFKIGNNCYPEMFLEEYKYIVTEVFAITLVMN